MNCYCDYEPSTVWAEKVVKARKAWRCCECRGTISVGETYRRASSLYDGRWSTYRRCADCAVIACDLKRMEKLNKEFCFCDLWEGMVDAIWQAWDWNAEDHGLLRPVIGAFNAASKMRGGIQISVVEFGEKEGGER